MPLTPTLLQPGFCYPGLTETTSWRLLAAAQASCGQPFSLSSALTPLQLVTLLITSSASVFDFCLSDCFSFSFTLAFKLPFTSYKRTSPKVLNLAFLSVSLLTHVRHHRMTGHPDFMNPESLSFILTIFNFPISCSPPNSATKPFWSLNNISL